MCRCLNHFPLPSGANILIISYISIMKNVLRYHCGKKNKNARRIDLQYQSYVLISRLYQVVLVMVFMVKQTSGDHNAVQNAQYRSVIALQNKGWTTQPHENKRGRIIDSLGKDMPWMGSSRLGNFHGIFTWKDSCTPKAPRWFTAHAT